MVVSPICGLINSLTDFTNILRESRNYTCEHDYAKAFIQFLQEIKGADVYPTNFIFS